MSSPDRSTSSDADGTADDSGVTGRGRSAVPRSLEVGAQWAWRLLIVAAAIIGLGWVFAQLRVVIIPVFVALILAALIGPLVELLERRLPRLLATWISVLGAVALVVVVGFLVQYTLGDTVGEVRSQWREALDEVQQWLVTGPIGLSESQAERLFDDLGEAVEQARAGLFDDPTSTARMAAEVVAGTLLAAVLTFFFLKDGRLMWAWLLDRVRPERRAALDAGARASFAAIQGWIRAVAITGLVDGVLIGVALAVLGVPGALPIAVITFFASFFPIVGATAAGVLATAVALVAEGPTTAVIVAIVVLVVQQVEGDVLLPLVMYRQVRLHPVVVLIALTAGAAIGGLIGALVAVPTTAAAAAFSGAARRTGTEQLVLPHDEDRNSVT